jgi:hypothetical protein
MGALHGRNGRLYADLAATPTTTGALTAVPFLADYSIEQARDRVETTAFGDGTKTYVAGLADASGSLSGFYDDTSNSLFSALTDGNARRFYLYVDASSAGAAAPVTTAGTGKGYWYGTGTFDASTSAGVGDAVKVTLNWSASSTISKV